MELTAASVREIKIRWVQCRVKCTTGISHQTLQQSVLELESGDDVRPTRQHKDSFVPLCHTAPHSALHMHRAFCEIRFQGKYLAAQKLFQYVSSRSKSFLIDSLQKQRMGVHYVAEFRGQGQSVGTLLSLHF